VRAPSVARRYKTHARDFHARSRACVTDDARRSIDVVRARQWRVHDRARESRTNESMNE